MKYFSVVHYIIEQRQPFKQTNKNTAMRIWTASNLVVFFFSLLQNLFKTKIGQEDV